MGKRFILARPGEQVGISRAREPEVAQTFLFADIRGYTAFTNQRGAEEAARLASRFTEAAHDAIEARGGEPLEIRGDQVLAVFSSASQAVRAAVEMQESFSEEAQDDPTLPLQVGVGLDSGQAVRGQSGYHGDVLNTAARLCSAAAPGEILLMPAVAEQAGDISGISYEECGPLVLKGLVDPVEPVRVVGIRPGRLGADDDPGDRSLPFELDPPIPVLACRAAEVHWLRGNWRLARRGRGRVVVVAGSPGIGKTRLCSELARVVFREGAHVAYASGHSGSEAQAALRQAIRSAGPTMFVLDDVASITTEMVGALVEIGEETSAHPVLIILGLRDEALDRHDIEELGDRFNEEGDSVRTLKPLDAEGIIEVAGLYAGTAASELPVHSVLASTGGIPEDVHQAVSLWARERALRHLHQSGMRAAAERSDLQAVESDLASSVADLELAEGQALLLEGATTTIVCPFKGLASFETSDADYFFGRERLVGELVARLASVPLLGVLGPSGSGKSSVVRAGLLPALDRSVLPGSESWRRVVIRPGLYPQAELHRALTAARFHDLPERGALNVAADQLETDQCLLVVVDQFEEVFTTCADESERAAFIDEVTSAADSEGSIRCVVVIWADFYDRCAAYGRLAQLLAPNHVLVGAMNEEELRRAIEMPVRRAGLWIEPELLSSMVADVKDAPGGLPFLSTTLVQLWDRRSGRSLRIDAYDRIGGLEGAVARLAEGVFGELSDAQQVVARAILLRLAGAGEGAAAVRRQAALSEFDLDASHDVAEVLTLLTEGRLLSVGEGTVEVAHEALLREWPRLRQWLDEDRHGRELHRHLIASAREWDASGRDPAELYRSARLAAILEWATDHDLEMNDLERQFISEGAKLQEHERRKTTRRLRLAAAAAVVVAIVLAVATVVSLAQRNTAQEERRTAQEQQRLASSREIAASATAQFGDDPELALLLAMEAVRIAPTEQAVDALRESIPRSKARTTFREEGNKAIIGSMFDTNGDTVITRNENGTVRLWDPVSGEILHTLQGQSGKWDGLNTPGWDLQPTRDGSILAFPAVGGFGRKGSVHIYNLRTAERIVALEGHLEAAFDVDLDHKGRRAVTASFDGTSRIWDLGNGRTLHTLRHNRGGLYTAEFSSDGRQVVTGGQGGQVRVWDVGTGRLVRVLKGLTGGVAVARFNPDGSIIATGGLDGTIRIWSTTTGEEIDVLRGHEDMVLELVFSPDGERVVSSSPDGTARLWKISTGRALAVLNHGGQGIGGQGAAFSDDGRLVATAGRDQVARVWDGVTGRLVGEFRGHSSPLWSVSFSPDGRFLLTSSEDGTAREWDLKSTTAIAVLRTKRGFVNDAEFSPDGRFVITTSTDLKRQRLWDTSSWTPIAVLKPHILGNDGDFAPDSKRVVVSGPGRIAAVWDVPSGSLVTRLPHTGTFGQKVVDFSPDGNFIVTSDHHGRHRIWDSSTGRKISTFHDESKSLDLLAGYSEFSPDGEVVATASDDGATRIWDPLTGRMKEVLRHGKGETWSLDFSPDGKLLATSSIDGKARIWDTVSGELKAVLRGHQAEVSPIYFSTDGRRVVTSGWDGTARVWDASTGKSVAVFRTTADALFDAVFSPDGSLVATGGNDGVVQIWDVETQRNLASLVGHRGEVQLLQFSPDGELLLSAGTDSTARVWRCETCGSLGELLALAETRVTRALTAEERALYLHEG